MLSEYKLYLETTPWSIVLNPRMASDHYASVTVFLFSLLMLGVADILVCSKFAKVGGTNARWFSLHAFANFFVVIFSIPDCWNVVNEPINCMNPKCSFSPYACTDIPVCIIAAIHLYHILAFKNLTWDDWFHHLVFAVAICALHFCYNWGPASSFLSFFISGFPGGIDYLMLSMVKMKMMPSILEKRINRYINVWCRAPGCLSTGILVYASYQSGFKQTHPVALILGCGLIFFNGQYYMERVVANHAQKHYVEMQSAKAQRQLSEVEEIRSTTGLHKIPSLENLSKLGGSIKRTFSKDNLSQLQHEGGSVKVKKDN